MNVVEALSAALPADRVVTDEAPRRAHAHDYWMLEAIHDRAATPATPPLAVVYPESTAEVSAILALATKHRAGVVPYGLGSGVCGAVLPGGDAVVVDLSRMNRMVTIDRDNLVAVAEPGLNGAECERLLAEKGLTCGHFPQSIAISTVGGWVATRAAGQLSTRYGNIEDLVLALEVVLPNGQVLHTFPTPRTSTGIDLRQLFLGSEGTLGIVTQVTLKVSAAPAFQEGFAARLPGWADGLAVIQSLLQEGWRPAVVRLYDEVEAVRHFPQSVPTPAPMLLVMSEGTAAMAAALKLELDAARAACISRGGEIVGEAPVQQWFGHRNAVPSWTDLLSQGLVADTIEIAATWDRIRGAHTAVTDAMKAVPGIVSASGHTSHAYTTGVNIYFTFLGAATEPAEQERIYRAAWKAAMEATVACGATISHHHGVGRVRRDWLEREIGAAGMAVRRAVKEALDPQGIMNPGVF